MESLATEIPKMKGSNKVKGVEEYEEMYKAYENLYY